jgi:hypothetical protein
VDAISSFWFFFTTAVAFTGLTALAGVVKIMPIDDDADDLLSSIADNN